jgi:TPP-dependent pyruvate/acetoin dehydrogenase alpha subunit
MCRIPRAEERIIKHYPEDQMKTPMHMSMGQEAVAVAFCLGLGCGRQMFGFYSDPVFLAKTEDSDFLGKRGE